MEHIGTQVRSLACKLTDAEKQKIGAELGQAWQDFTTEQSWQTSQKAEMKARMTEIEARMTRLSQVLSRGDEMRAVNVTKALLDNGMVQEVREDTGEIIAIRPVRDEERQLTMAPEPVADLVAEANRSRE